MSTDVFGYLNSKGLQTKRAPGDEVHVPCIFCDETIGKRGRLYINVNPDADIPGLFHCFAGDTRVITGEGTRAIAELAGGTHSLLTAGGRWVDAPVQAFGVQETYAVTLRRDRRTKVIRATAGHRWFRRVTTSNGIRRREMVTTDLRQGDRLSFERPQTRVRGVRLSPFGVARGFVYGDGTVAHRGSVACLHGEKDRALMPYFEGCGQQAHERENGEKYVRVTDMPRYFKTERPDLSESASYLYGWLAGYFAADGTVSRLGQPSLWCADRETLEWVRDLCTSLGIVTYGISTTARKGFGGVSDISYVALAPATLTDEFFIIPEHRERFVRQDAQTIRLGWTVEKVELHGVEEVFCAVVPETESFVLEDNILVGNCKICDRRGSLVSIQKHFGDATEKQEQEDTGYLRRAILATAADYYHQALTDNAAALQWLKVERGLTIETIMKHQLGYAGGGLFHHLRTSGFRTEHIAATGLIMTDRNTQRPVDFFNDHITIPYHTAGSVVMIRGRALGDSDEGSKYKTPMGQKTRLFNTDVTWDTDELVITEGEFDCMVVEQLGYKAIACPGANVWQDAWDGYFTDARRVWVVFDRDERQVGAKGAAKVLEHLGAAARLVELPPHDHGKSKNDVTEYLVTCGHSAEEFELLLRANRGHLVTVDDAIAEWGQRHAQAGLAFGIPQLDIIIRPGLLPTQVMVVLAKSGTGKTMLLLNMFHWMSHLKPDIKILFLSLELTRGDWWDRARRIYGFWHTEINDPREVERQAADFWRQRLWLDDRNRITVDDLSALLDDYVYETGSKPDLVAVDYLGYWAQGFKGDRYERTSDAIMALKAFAKAERLPCIAPHQVSRGTTHGGEPNLDNARDSGVIEETADFVLSLWTLDTLAGKTLEERTGVTQLKLIKSRHGGVGLQQAFYFAPISLVLVQDIPRNAKQAEWARNELWYQTAYHEEWEHAQMRHRAGTPRETGDFRVVEKKLWHKQQQKLEQPRLVAL